MVTLDYEEVARRLDEVAADLGDAPRALECGRILRAGAEQARKGGLQGTDQIREFAVAFQDASLIVGAYDLLGSATEVPTARDRLREALAGDTVIVPETGDDEPRNQLWPTFLAARFQQQHMAPQFADALPATPGIHRPDLLLNVDGVCLAVEAKRVRSYGKLGRRVRKSVEQIAEVCERGDASAGFMALDLSFAVNQHAQSGLWSLPSREAATDVRGQLVAEVTRLLKTIGEMAGGEPGSRHVMGATILVLPVMHYGDTRQMGLVRYFVTGYFDGDRSVAGQTAFRSVHERCFSDR